MPRDLKRLGIKTEKVTGRAVTPEVFIPKKLKLKRRAIYFYDCELSGKKRHSRIYTRAMKKTCRKCVPVIADERQKSLF